MNDCLKDKIDFFVEARHYYDHALPIWRKLPSQKKGNFYISTHIHNIKEYPLPKDEKIIVFNDLSSTIKELKGKKGLLVVFGLNKLLFNCLDRAFILVSHGVGQTIGEGNKYIPYHEKCLLYILPNTIIENVYKRKYPHVKTYVAGCPKLDYWHTNPVKIKKTNPVITISFQYDSDLVPETKSSWPYFKPALVELASQKAWTILGHGHPGIIDELTPYYQQLGIEVVRDFDEVMERSTLYICDNSSTLYEFASTGRPVVVLNAPWFRRDIEHGLRFWEHADVGVNCDHPKELIPKIKEALRDSEEQKRLREKAVRAVYAVTDGTASQKAVEAIIACLDSEEYKEYWDRTSANARNYPGVLYLLRERLLKNRSKNKTLIFGGGEHTIRLLKIIGGVEFNIIGIIDNDVDKQGTYILGHQVYSPKMIDQLHPDIIIISSYEHEKAIYEQLRDCCRNEIKIHRLYSDNINFREDIFCELYLGSQL